MQQKWKGIPSDSDILVTHGPPLGYGDMLLDGETRVGCADLLWEVMHKPPALHVFGHVHEGYGISTNGVTVFANASTCTHGRCGLEPRNKALVMDIQVDLVQ